MVIMRSKELRDLSSTELQNKLDELHAEYETMISKSAVSGVENPGKIKEIKRTIARVLTIINENKIQGELE
ncbi:MAG: 50S ribosomal protein L29 [Methanobacteriaceae archaeon]|nr:50S ribosomal protein L29 [Methanobacteriaceae archaeon]